MKNNFYLLFTFLFLCTALKAQHNHDEGQRKEQLERVQAAKVGFLTDKINLTEGQAQKFWPMYNQHSDQRREIFHDIRRKIRTGKEEGVSVIEKNKLLDETMILKEKDLEMQKDFKKKVLDVISVDQYIELMSAEREFNKLLMERLGKRKKPN
jgi:Spy/CpxP family protein refolding chaperone